MTLTFLFALSAVLNDKLAFYQNTRCRHIAEIWFDLDRREGGASILRWRHTTSTFIIIFYLQNPHFQKIYPFHWGLCPDFKKLLSSQLQIIRQKHCIVGPFKLFNRSIAGGSTIGNRRQCRGSTRHVWRLCFFHFCCADNWSVTVNCSLWLRVYTNS